MTISPAHNAPSGVLYHPRSTITTIQAHYYTIRGPLLHHPGPTSTIRGPHAPSGPANTHHQEGPLFHNPRSTSMHRDHYYHHPKPTITLSRSTNTPCQGPLMHHQRSSLHHPGPATIGSLATIRGPPSEVHYYTIRDTITIGSH
ncbi:hypothetical protein AVEN_110157-1 [Araneus ventricosus]|uniref:Uncharacterized protein n=1 Tax=Araneus ventricosus TaxID=182803 RepID=A0A4Y2EBF0_ARAVE|nr:hypothetical protein AVEN_110157-1 [Araneus ventricosus]